MVKLDIDPVVEIVEINKRANIGHLRRDFLKDVVICTIEVYMVIFRMELDVIIVNNMNKLIIGIIIGIVVSILTVSAVKNSEASQNKWHINFSNNEIEVVKFTDGNVNCYFTDVSGGYSSNAISCVKVK